MKKIIDGKVYNTTSAEKIAEYSSVYARSDFNYYEETLFRKRTGEYFLYGSGNAASRYAESCGQSEWCGGERIIPLTLESAKKWAENHLDGDEYENIFGVVVEDEGVIAVSYRLNVSTVERIKRIAQERGISQLAIVQELLDKALDV